MGLLCPLVGKCSLCPFCPFGSSYLEEAGAERRHRECGHCLLQVGDGELLLTDRKRQREGEGDKPSLLQHE